MFCPECGSILEGSKQNGEEVFECSCGYSSTDEDSEFSEDVEEGDELEVVDEDQSDETLPITDEECPECGNEEARYWTQQMRSGDEPETQFFKCTECSHTWREG